MQNFSRKNSSAEILEALSSSSGTTDKTVKNQLREHRFTLKDLPLIYKAITKPYPDDPDPHGSTKSILLYLLWELHDKDTLVFIKENYPALPDNPDIRFHALRALLQINSPESVEIFLDILTEQRPVIESHPLFIPLYNKDEHAGLVFPRLFDLLDERTYKYSIYHLTLNYLERGLMEAAQVNAIMNRLEEDLEAATLNRSLYGTGSMEYDDAISMIAIILDLMGYIREESIIKTLNGYVRDPAPNVSLCAALSLIYFDERVPEDVIRLLAANPQTRLHLYEALDFQEKTHLFPSEFLTQACFAETEMVRWLSHPMEFNRPPDEIELLESRIVTSGGNSGRLYLFKYRYNDYPDGWLVSASGLFSQDEKKLLLTSKISLTFSHFKKLAEMSMDEHFKSFLH